MKKPFLPDFKAEEIQLLRARMHCVGVGRTGAINAVWAQAADMTLPKHRLALRNMYARHGTNNVDFLVARAYREGHTKDVTFAPMGDIEVDPRHIAMLQMMIEQKSRAEIADKLEVSEFVLTEWVSALFDLFGLRDRIAVISRALVFELIA